MHIFCLHDKRGWSWQFMLRIQVASAETLVDSAAELILDASRMMDDAGDELGRQVLEGLSVHVVREFQQIRERLGVLSGEMT